MAREVPITDSVWNDDHGIENPTGPHDLSIGRDDEEDEEVSMDGMEGMEGEIESTTSDVRPDPLPNVAVNNGVDIQQQHHQTIGCCQRFGLGIRALWATRETEDTKDNRELQIKITLRELIVYSVFLTALCILTYGMTSSTTYYFTNAITELFLNVKADPSDPESTYRHITTAADWYTYAMGPFLGGLFNEALNTNQTLSTYDRNFILYDNKMLGLPRLRLLRVRNDSCTVHEDFQNIINTCYAPYSYEAEDTRPYGPANGTAWIYQTQAELNGATHWGILGVYGGGGYVQDLTTDNLTSFPLIEILQGNNWIDRGTRALFIDFSLYNANVNLFCVIRLLCEFPATGGVLPSWNIRTVKLIRYVLPLDYFVLACECIFVLYIAYFIVEEILEIKRNKLSYFKNCWNILDILIICMSLCSISFNVYRTVAVNLRLQDLVNEPTQFMDFDSISYWQVVFNSTLAVTIFLAWIKVFKYISFSKTMTQLSATLSSCSRDLAGFSFMFFIVFLAFAQLGYLIFGASVEGYSTFSLAIFSQFLIILGDFDFESIEQANRVLGPIYFILFVFFVFFVLLNMFLAIINDTFSEVKADISRKKNEFEMVDLIKKCYQKILGKLNLKRDKNAGVKNSTKSKSGTDKCLDFEEWRNDRKRHGFAEAEVVAAFSQLDRHERGHGDIDKRKYPVHQRHEYDKEDSLDGSNEDEDDSTTVKSSSQVMRRRSNSGVVTHEEHSMLQRRVERMEHSIGSIVSKIDAVLVKLETMETAKAKRRETIGRLLDSITESEGTTEESKRQHMERLVRDELERWDSESCISGFEASPASSSSGRGSGRAHPPAEPTPEFFTASSA